MNDIERFGALLKSAREEEGLTLTQLGDLVGYSNPYLSQIESGKRKNPPSPELIKKLADALNLPYGAMLEAAGYHELAEAERLKSAYEDFGDEYSIVKLHQRNRTLEKALDLKILLDQKSISFQTEEIEPSYNGHLLTEQDQERILKMLELLFPEYQIPAKADK